MNNLFIFSKNKHFETCMQTYINPQIKSHFRNTTKNIIHKKIIQDKDILIQIFFSLLCKISLTSDVWMDQNKFAYLCLTAHLIDISWNLQKRIITFKIFDRLYSSKAIANIIEYIVKEFKINNKINTISIDNALNNNVAIDILRRNLKPMLNGDLFHCGYSYHIFNLIVQECIQ